MSSVQQTSLFAYHELSPTQINARQKQVLNGLREIEPATDRMVAEHTGIPINVVTPRRGELVKKSLVVQESVRFDLNRRRAIFWKTTHQRGSHDN